MRNFLGFIIAVTITVFFINYINVGTQVKRTAISSEAVIANASEAFLDKVADSGAITSKDWTRLSTELMKTGGTFNITLTVSRLYPIPDPVEDGSYVLDFRPAYGWTSTKGGFPDNYVDPNWQSGQGNPAPVGVQYLVKADNVALTIQQVDAMDYQRTMVARMSLGANLGQWNFAKAVRDTGSTITGNQTEPFN